MNSVAIVVFLSSIYAAFGQNITEGGLQIPIINKCSCDALTVKTEKGCVSQNSSHFISLWDDVEEQDYPLDLTLYNTSVVVQPVLDCPPGTTKEDSELDHAFIAIEDGRIIYHGFKTEHYCIETVLVAEGQIAQRLEACVENIKVRTCCKITETVDANGTCSTNKKILPELLPVQWLSGFDRYIRGVTCPDGKLTVHAFPLITLVPDLRQLLSQYEVTMADKYCLNLLDDEDEIQLGILSCEPLTNLKIPICCSMMDTFDLDSPSQECVPSTEIFSYPTNVFLSTTPMWRPSSMSCSEFQILYLSESQFYNFTLDGSLIDSTGFTIPFDKFCLGTVSYNNKTYHSGLSCLPEVSKICQWRFVVQSVCLAISSFFIILTLIVYLSISDLRRRIGGVCLISELISLLVAQITLIVIYNKEEWTNQEGCLSAGAIELIFVLASFFWLNVMCYDVWSTFRVLRPFSEKVFNVKIFVKYSLYAWGLPLIVGVIAVVLQKYDIRYKPNFTSEVGCFFTNSGADYTAVHWIYLYGPVLALLLANMGFFIHLAITLVPTQIEHRKLFNKSGGKASSDSNLSYPNVEDVKLYVKLFVTMGLPWLIELFTSFASVEIKCYIWFFDLFNSLRGILIFVIFVCKRNIRDKILKTWFPTTIVETESSSMRSRKTSAISMSWWTSAQGRKISTTYNATSMVDTRAK